MKLLARLGLYLASQPRFLIACTVLLGIPVAALAASLLSDRGEFAQVLGVVVSILGSLAWGLIMWRLMFRDIYARIEVLKQKTEGAQPSERRNA
jgi:hypothetical protein